jgi:zinc/manganese transport system substrate-binding protein
VGGELYSDALSDESGPAATYIDMMRHNVTTIKGAILGS